MDAVVNSGVRAQVAPQPQAGEAMLTPEEEAAIVEDINSGRWPYLQPSSGDGPPVYASPQPANPAQVTDAQIEHMVQQFLRWKLPEDFNPDGGISFDPIMNLGTEHQSRREPSGTNLFDYRQAKAMVQHMLDGLAAIGAGWQAVAEDATISEMVRAYNRTTDYIFPQATDKEQREAMRAVYATLFQPHPADERVVEGRRRAVGQGMAIAAGIVMNGWGNTVYAKEILGAAGYTSVEAMKADGVEDYDIDLCRPALDELSAKEAR